MVQTNKLLKTVQGTYKKFTNVQKQNLKNSPNQQENYYKNGKDIPNYWQQN